MTCGGGAGLITRAPTFGHREWKNGKRNRKECKQKDNGKTLMGNQTGKLKGKQTRMPTRKRRGKQTGNLTRRPTGNLRGKQAGRQTRTHEKASGQTNRKTKRNRNVEINRVTKPKTNRENTGR